MAWRLDHVNLRTQRLEVLRAFYVDVLGLEDGPRPPFGHPGAWLYAGLHPVMHLWAASPADTEAPTPGREPQLSHFAFAADDEAAFVARLRRAGVPFERQSQPGREVVQLMLRDPDGNALHVDFAATSAQPGGHSAPLTCGQEIARSAELHELWAALMEGVAATLDSHARWVGTTDDATRAEHAGVTAVAAASRDIAAAARRAVGVMRPLATLPEAAHDPARRELDGERTGMRKKLLLQRRLARLLMAHADEGDAALAALDAPASGSDNGQGG